MLSPPGEHAYVSVYQPFVFAAGRREQHQRFQICVPYYLMANHPDPIMQDLRPNNHGMVCIKAGPRPWIRNDCYTSVCPGMSMDGPLKHRALIVHFEPYRWSAKLRYRGPQSSGVGLHLLGIEVLSEY